MLCLRPVTCAISQLSFVNSWRATGDHHDSWESTSGIIEQVASLASYAGPGGWNVMERVLHHRSQGSIWTLSSPAGRVAPATRRASAARA